MDQDTLKFVAVALVVLWIASALVTLTGNLRTGAYLNALVSTAIGAATLPTLGAALIDRQEYIYRYGAAATQQLPLVLSVLCLSLVGVCLSLAALWRGLGLFAIGWFANTPVVMFAIYLVFWVLTF